MEGWKIESRYLFFLLCGPTGLVHGVYPCVGQPDGMARLGRSMIRRRFYLLGWPGRVLLFFLLVSLYFGYGSAAYRLLHVPLST